MKILLAAVLLALSACTTQQMLDSASTANDLIDLRIAYDDAARGLDDVIDDLPVETALALLDLKQEADRYVAELTRAWRRSPDLSADALESYYLQGRALYLRGRAIVAPVVHQLPPDTYARLLRLQRAAERIDGLYQQIQGQDAQTRQLIQAGLELATLALKIGMVAL